MTLQIPLKVFICQFDECATKITLPWHVNHFPMKSLKSIVKCFFVAFDSIGFMLLRCQEIELTLWGNFLLKFEIADVYKT